MRILDWMMYIDIHTAVEDVLKMKVALKSITLSKSSAMSLIVGSLTARFAERAMKNRNV